MLDIPEVMNAKERSALLKDLKDLQDYFSKTENQTRNSFEQTVERVVRGALTLYDETEPRLMEPIEVFSPIADGLVYVEGFGAITPAIVTDRTIVEEGRTRRWLSTQQLSGDWLYEDTYGIVWRCWTKRPSDEQRNATPWQKEQKVGE